ncbi:MAG: PEGA domain-containing protein [Myxococcales bacterium]|nr:PEGA domain-containing protein [Myxococcales bacterium]
MRSLVAVVLLAISLLLPSLAPSALAAKGRQKTLVIVDWRGPWTAKEQIKLFDALAIGFDGAGLDRVESQISGFVLDDRFKGCITREACHFEYARATGASYVFVVLMVKLGKSTRVAMTLYNIPLLAQSAVAVQKGKGLVAAIGASRRLIGTMLDRERKMPRGALEIASTPVGDALFVDGHAAGATPVNLMLYAGPHLVRIERKGAAPHVAHVTVVNDKTVRYEARFEKTIVPITTDGK